MLRRPPSQLGLTRDDIQNYTSRRAERLQHAPAATSAARANGWPSFRAEQAPSLDDGEEDADAEERDLDASIPDADADADAAGSDEPTEPDSDPDADADVDMDEDTFDGRGARGPLPASSALAAATATAAGTAAAAAGDARGSRMRQPQFAPRAQQADGDSVAAQRRRRIVGEQPSRAVRAPGVSRRMGGER